jgi:hypothetical protein
VIGSDYPFSMVNPGPVDAIRSLGLGQGRETKMLGRTLAR